MEVKKESLEEKQNRKDVARRRTFWFLVLFNLVLIIYIFIQVIMILVNK